jgi:hypothetical protein
MATQTRSRRKPPGPKLPPGRIRVSEVIFKGFKAFREPFLLRVDPPVALPTPDVFVVAGPNGGGKTSALEGICVALLLPACTEREGPPFHLMRALETSFEDPYEMESAVERLVSTGAPEAAIDCHMDTDHEPVSLRGTITRKMTLKGTADPASRYTALHTGEPFAQELAVGGLRTLIACDLEPVIAPPVLYFHSYRKVQEANPELSDLVGRGSAYARPGRPYRRAGPLVSRFKSAVVNALLAQQGSIEGLGDAERAQPSMARLNELVEAFAGGKIEAVRTAGNRLDIRVRFPGVRESVPLDALSSGQKEIISTLFLIWESTRDRPSVVLIDEPELHLNSEWHDDIIRWMTRLAPDNQYILATHSQRIAESVAPGHVRWLEA